MTIKEITEKGIYYADNSGQNNFLSFTECHENWLAYRKKTENLSDEKINELRKTDKMIGQRDVCHDPAFIEFFTRPFTRFVFDLPKQTNEYEHLRNTIYMFGWNTIDWS